MTTRLALSLLAFSFVTLYAVAAEDAPPKPPPTKPQDVTPTAIPGSEAFVYKKIGDVEMRLFVFKPKGWKATDKRSCMVTYFGGGWIGGTPVSSSGYARWAASLGMIGVAPDYRTRNRFKTSPEECVADGRAAFAWLQSHAEELGLNPEKMVALGLSAGGHVAAWTAIRDPVSEKTAQDPIPKFPPAALFLLWPVTDTTAQGYGGPKRFDNDEARAAALSVTGRMPAKMPPTLVFHGTADKTVKYENSVDFIAKMKANGNKNAELISYQNAPHSATSTKDKKAEEIGNDIKNKMKDIFEKLEINKK